MQQFSLLLIVLLYLFAPIIVVKAQPGEPVADDPVDLQSSTLLLLLAIATFYMHKFAQL